MIKRLPNVRIWTALVLAAGLCGGCHDQDTGGAQLSTPTITWSSPAAISYGTALSSTQLNATASVPGTFAYSPAAGTVLGAGSHSLSTTFTPTDGTHYKTAAASVELTVNKATPTLSWSAPAAISQGTPLGAAQLDATASVAGTFAYTPAAATVLSAGTQTLSVLFAPTDTDDYTTASASVSITVNAPQGIGPSGGSVHGYYGASVTVPGGALSGSTDIEIVRDSAGAPALPAQGLEVAGGMYALTPHGTSFAAAAMVQIPFDSDRIPTDAVPVIYKAEAGGSFTPLATTINGGFLSANVDNFSWVIPGYASSLPRMVYALTRADVNGGSTISLSGFKISKDTGVLAAPSSSAPVGNGAISVTVHPSRRFAYVSNGSGSAHGASAVAANSVSVYQLDAVTGAITGPVDSKPVNGNPIAVVVHPTGKFVYVVNEVRFGGTIGNISAFSIDQTTGALSSLGTVGDLAGVPATALAFAPSGEFAYVTYMPPDPSGNNNFDTVKTYGVGGNGLFTANPIGSAPTGDNPWALVVTPGGHFAYVASLSAQGNVDQIAVYAINQTSGTLSLQNSFGISTANGQSPLSLAMDSEARFLYVGLQSLVFFPPNSNFNVLAFAIGSNGSLTLASGAGTPNNPEGPISLVAEPEAEFLYVMDGNGQISAFDVSSSGALSLAGNPTGGAFVGGNSGGVGDPFLFAAGGTSPVWQNFCTVLVDNVFVYDGCFGIVLGSGPGAPGRIDTGTSDPPPAASFVLHVVIDSAGGSVESSPAGIDINDLTGGDTYFHGFPSGTAVSLTASPPDTLNAYDITWTGSCGGTGPTVYVVMSQDQNCYVTFTPTSQR